MPKLHVIKDLADPLCSLISDDPVRPEIPLEFRVSASSEIFVLLDDLDQPSAAVCCAYRNMIPSTVVELAQQPEHQPHVAVFYTIWSYKSGAGRKLITAAQDWIQANKSHVSEFVTLSPTSDMARDFHLRNGAAIFRINPDTVNYLYPSLSN